MKGKLSHYDEKGEARMVDVSAKTSNLRTASAHAFVKIRPEVLAKLPENPKGDPLAEPRRRGFAGGEGRGPHHHHGFDRWADGGGNGSVDGRERGGVDGVRYDKSAR
jgi:hypothetical protein